MAGSAAMAVSQSVVRVSVLIFVLSLHV
jgi:hypothetical protein